MKKGFTLIELLVVIAIIALLSSVVLASLSSARVKSRDARRIADLKQIQLALEMFYDDKGEYPGVNGTGAGINCITYATNSRGSLDCSGYRVSNVTGATNQTWDEFETDLRPYMARTPKDPINTPACGPWTIGTTCYAYAYGNPGKLTKPTYDLVARLESSDNPLICSKQNYRYGYGIGNPAGTNVPLYPTGSPWCGPEHPQLYDVSPN